MHVYVQNCTSTTLPRRPSGVSGDELSQSVAPSNDGNRPSTGSSRTAGWVEASKALSALMVGPPGQ